MKRIILIITAFAFLKIVNAQDSNWKKTAFGTTVQYHNSNGKLMESWNVDTNEKLVNNDLGFAIVKYKYDKNGNIIEQEHLDPQRNPAVDNLGVAIWRFKYDKNNNKTYQGHFGIDGKLMITNDNIVYSEWFWKYTKEGELKKTITKNKL
jgi:YD repeat-containing protein